MIRVIVELWPHGDPSKKKRLGVMTITNDGKGTSKKGGYDALAMGKTQRWFRRSRVEDFPRQRLVAWDLVYRALRGMVGDRNR